MLFLLDLFAICGLSGVSGLLASHCSDLSLPPGSVVVPLKAVKSHSCERHTHIQLLCCFPLGRSFPLTSGGNIVHLLSSGPVDVEGSGGSSVCQYGALVTLALCSYTLFSPLVLVHLAWWLGNQACFRCGGVHGSGLCAGRAAALCQLSVVSVVSLSAHGLHDCSRFRRSVGDVTQFCRG